MRERGLTLLVVLVMLVVITLLGIAAVRISNSSMLVVGNMQARKFTENYGERAIEQVMNSITPFDAPTSAITFDPAPAGAMPAGLTVDIGPRTCTYSAPASGYSAIAPIVPEDNNWEFKVTVTDSFTGAKSVMVQGAKIRQLSGSCP